MSQLEKDFLKAKLGQLPLQPPSLDLHQEDDEEQEEELDEVAELGTAGTSVAGSACVWLHFLFPFIHNNLSDSHLVAWSLLHLLGAMNHCQEPISLTRRWTSSPRPLEMEMIHQPARPSECTTARPAHSTLSLTRSRR